VIGQTISHYKIIEKLGEGGMGVVYKAQDLRLDRLVALKFLPQHLTANEAEKARFLQEAKAASALNHPNVCTIYGIEEHENPDGTSQQFIEMEYVDGVTLREKVGETGLKVQDAVTYAIQVGEALAEAHSKGIVHRDIKCENIMVNSKNQVKVMDFGLAKLKGTLKLTRTSSTVGTLAYMSPEQIQGGEVDSRSDIFSFGVVFYEMLTGHIPFRGEHEAALVYSIVNEDPEPIQKYLPEISGEIVHTLGKALEKNPEDRYQSVQEMVLDLCRAKKDTSKLGRSSGVKQRVSHEEIALEKTGGSSSRKKMWIGLGALAVIALGGVLYYFIFVSNASPSLPPMKITRLTSYPGEEYYPALSPDGKSFAFSWNGPRQDNFDIYVKLVDAGVPVRLTTNPLVDNNPVWSHDGSFIAFVRENEIKPDVMPREIFVIPSIGGREQKIIEYHPGLTGHPSISWAKDDKSIYFVNWSMKDSGFVIFKVSIETKEVQQITQLLPGVWGDQSPSVSPDGKYVAFIRYPVPDRGDITVKNLMDNSVHPITNLQTWIDGFSWTGNSHSIIFAGNIDGSSALWKVDLSGGSAEKLFGGIDINNPSISEEGNRLVYAETIRNANIWKIDLRNPQKETEVISSSTFDNVMPDISPDGKKIIFSSDRTGTGNIWECDSDGTNQTQLTTFSNIQGPVAKWSPNGLEILVSTEKGGYILNPAGGTPQKISLNRMTHPIWSEDGAGFYGTKYPEDKVYKYSKDGNPQRQVTSDNGIMPRLYGSYIYYIKDFNHHDIWRIPIKGGKEEPVLEGVTDILFRQWVVVRNGIYFIRDNSGSPVLDFYSTRTKQISQIKKLPQAVRDPFIEIDISPDESYLLYSRREPTKSDIILVDNFR
jgi:Tol biopolymer transport system component/predicted Ser/Thr protein kinase